MTGQRHGRLKVSLDLEVATDIGLRNGEIASGVPEHAPQGAGMLDHEAETRGIGLGRPLATVPIRNCEVARMIVIQQQPEEGKCPVCCSI
jgi:hypothetical protein